MNRVVEKVFVCLIAALPVICAAAFIPKNQRRIPSVSIHVSPGGNDAGDGSAARPFRTLEGERYRLSSSKPANTTFIPQSVDLADRSSQLGLYDPVPISKDEPQANVMTFVSEPFDSPVNVSGMITGRLDAAINKRDMDFTMSFYELMPDGRRFRLSYYLGRASYARDMTRRMLLTPGKRTLIPFERAPLISRRMSVGSRLLVMLTVNKNNWAQINYGTGKDVSDESIADAKEPLQVRWYNDSYVTVPVER